MSHSISDRQAPARASEIAVEVTETGPGQYTILATATLDAAIAAVWALFDDFERFVAAALPGIASEFAWLEGGPGRAPAAFQFVTGGARVVEEIHACDPARHTLRYRLRAPALGLRAYEGAFALQPISDAQTSYSARREVTLDPGVLDRFVALIALETRHLKNHFAQRP
jgi:hypothetical protein